MILPLSVTSMTAVLRMSGLWSVTLFHAAFEMPITLTNSCSKITHKAGLIIDKNFKISRLSFILYVLWTELFMYSANVDRVIYS